MKVITKNFKKPLKKLTKKQLDELLNYVDNEIFEWKTFRNKLACEYKKRKNKYMKLEKDINDNTTILLFSFFLFFFICLTIFIILTGYFSYYLIKPF